MTVSHKALRLAYQDWFQTQEAQLAVTGSVKQSVATPPLFLTREYAAPDAVERNVRQVMERASRDILGRKSVQQGHSLSYAAAIEGLDRPAREGGERLHIHLAIGGLPEGFSLNEAAKIIERRWQQSRWGYKDNLTQSLLSPKARNCWLAYCLKRLSLHNSERYFISLSPRNRRTHK